MRRILIVGGGYAGFYTAWGLEKRLHRDEAEVVLVDPRPYMTYQPFLPEVTAGSVEARHVAVALRGHLHRTKIIAGSVVEIDHARRTARVQPLEGPERDLTYDTIVVTAGAVTRTFGIPGIAENAIGLKHVEEAVAIRDRLLTAFERAATLEPGPRRSALLTVTVVGGGFTGVEATGELLSLATALLKRYPELTFDELSFHLVEAKGRILPEVTDGPGAWVVRHLERRGAHVHLNTQLLSATDGHIKLSDGTEYDGELLLWTAGNAANPVVAAHTDLPIDARGMLQVRADLRVALRQAQGAEGAEAQGAEGAEAQGADEVVEDAWGAGDNAAVPDLVSDVPGALTVPNAQHAVRQGRLLAANLVAELRGRKPKPYRHHSLGVVATLGLGQGIFQFHRLVIKGFPAWVMHRGYHVLAVPTWERKIRVLLVWIAALFFGRDTVSLLAVQHPRQAFTEAAAPKEVDHVR